jgi:hypothetical protein
MAYQPGEIYFIREYDHLTGKRTKYVKIGLVRYSKKRNSWERLSDHQTGNPRPLKLLPKHIIQTQAVHLVEAKLHRKFAEQRFRGEWFEFATDAALEKAVRIAKDLAEEVKQSLPAIVRVEKYKSMVSNGELAKANEYLNDTAFSLAVNKAKKKQCEKIRAELDSRLVIMMESGEDVTAVSVSKTTTYSPRFDEDSFHKVHPKIWMKYLEVKESVSGSFLLKVKVKDEELGKDFYSQIAQIRKAIERTNEGDILGFVDAQMAIDRMLGEIDWEILNLEAILKSVVKGNDGIEGLCTWKRTKSEKTIFNSQKFAQENPKLARDFVTVPPPKKTIKPKKSKV